MEKPTVIKHLISIGFEQIIGAEDFLLALT